MARNTLFLFIISFILLSRADAQTGHYAQFSFSESKYDFGEILAGDTAVHEFEFVNTGRTPLIIEKIITTCGCTAPSWPEDPVAPGEKGKIRIVFDATGKIGRQNKIITIVSNAGNPRERLHVMANVIPAP